MGAVDREHYGPFQERLARSRLLFLFTPAACPGRDPFEVLAEVLPFVDIVQVRPKALAGADEAALSGAGVQSARETFELCQRVLECVQRSGASTLVTVNDRVDVARALQDAGCAGVHLGQEDCPPDIAREVLGPGALIGLSTHSLAQVALADSLPVDYLGFGPIHATATKGYARGLGAEAAWIAAQASDKPLFPIGGIGLANAAELAQVGRAAVASALFAAQDPAASARALRALLNRGAED